MAALYPWMHLIGRVCLSLIFVNGGIGHLTKMDAMLGYAQSKKAPWPKVTVPLTGIMILVGGVLVILGWHRFVGAGLLFIFLVLAAYFMHPYWKETDPMTRAAERAHFYKNVALAGAALLVAFYARYTWPLSLGG